MIVTLPTAQQRILRAAGATVSIQWADGDGLPVAPTAPVLLDVRSSLLNAAVVSDRAATGTGSGAYSATLSAAETALLDLLTLSWQDSASRTATTYAEVVGGYYFTPAELREFDTSLDDPARYTDAAIVRARRQVEDEFEQIAGVAFVPRYRLVIADGTGTSTLYLRTRRVRVVSELEIVDPDTDTRSAADAELWYHTIDASRLVCTAGAVWPAGRGNVLVHVEHGYDRPPEDLKVAAMRRCRQKLNATRGGIPDGADRWTTQDGSIVYATIPGRGRIGDPDIDAVLARYTIAPPGVA